MPLVSFTCANCGAEQSKYVAPCHQKRGHKQSFCNRACRNAYVCPIVDGGRRCSSCKEIRPVGDFYANKAKKDGINSACKHCSKKAWTEFRKERPESGRAAGARSYRRHCETRKAEVVAYQKRNPDKLKEWMKSANHKQYLKLRERLKTDNDLRERLREKSRRRKVNPEKAAVRYHRRRARFNTVRNDLTADQWIAKLDYFNGRCAYCLAATQLTMDHMVPISLGGAHTDENVVPACGRCNTSKGAKPFLQWICEAAA